MDILKQIINRGLVFALAVVVLGAGTLMASDNSGVQAETLSSVYLTNKGTAYTTEASPPVARTAPASRKNASTVYVTMTDVDTANAVSNSHLIDANKVVITIVEPDHNTKVAVMSADTGDAGPNEITAAAWGANTTHVVEGSAGNPVIDTDNDGVLDDEITYQIQADGAAPTWNGTAFSGSARANSDKILTVSVANGDSATGSSKPMITAMITTAITGISNGDEIYLGYYSSAVNTFQVKAWSTVQLESQASFISVVETGRNTGVFEAEFVVADTEGVNDALTTEATTSLIATGHANLHCGVNHGSAVVSDESPAAGRFDKFGGTNADCEFKLFEDFDLNAAGNGAIAAEATADVAATIAIAAGEYIIDVDGDGSVADSVFFDAGSGTSLVANSLKLYEGDGHITVNSITCSAGDTTCKTPHTAARTASINITVAAGGEEITHGNDDLTDMLIAVGNNVVDNAKVDTDLDNDVDADDVKTGRVGSDTKSSGGQNGLANGALKSGVLGTGSERTPIVEAQANSTITVQYQDLTDSSTSTSATTGTKVKATVTVDAAAPTPVVTSPTSGSSFKDRQPTFKGSVSDIGSGIDVSTATLYVDMLNDTDASGLTSAITTTNLAGSWLGGAGTINLQDRYDAMAVTLDNTTTMTDGVTSITWTVATSANIPCSTGTADGTNEAGIVNDGGSTHTNFAGAIACNDALATPDVVVDFMLSATDLAGNRGFSDSITTDTDSVAVGDPYTINIDEQKPALVAADTETGVYYDPGSYAEKTGDATKLVVAFDDEIGSAEASSFEVTSDAGVVMTPSSIEIGTKGTNASGSSYDFRKNVYLTLPSALATSETPKVKLVGDVADLAGNSTKSGSVSNAIDKIKPTLTLSLAGGSGTGASGTSNDSDSLTKKTMKFTITTSEVLSSPPTVSIFSENYGTGATYTTAADALCDIGALDGTDAGGNGGTTGETANCDFEHTVIDTDRDGSLTDEVVIAAHASNPVSATVLAGLTIVSVTNGEYGVAGGADSNDVRVVVRNTSSSDAANASADQIQIHANVAPAASTALTDDATNEGTVASVAQDSKTYTATFNGTDATWSDASAKDSKAVLVSATDASTSPNTGTVGTRDQSSSSVYKFRLDKTAPVLSNDPDGDGTVGSDTTLPRPYVIFDFTDNSAVDVQSASFGGDDVLALLATTNSKKYFMVPADDLAAKTYAVKAKGTDVAGNKGAEGSYNLKVTARKDYKATILAGWNLMSFPSDPISNNVDAVFSNTGIDQVVGYDAMAKGSPWTVATKDSSSGIFSGSLSTISSGNGYWVHSNEFSTQSVALTGPEGPSASAPPSISSIELASGWNLVGVIDPTKALTQANEGSCINTIKNVLGEDGGSSVTKAYEYNTTSLAWSEVDLTQDTACATPNDAHQVDAGEAFWVFATPAASGLLTPIVP